MGRLWCLVVTGCLIATGVARAEEPSGDEKKWKRIDSRYCTMWLHPSIETKKVNRAVSTWRVRPRVKVDKGDSEESELAAKCDILFRRAQEILDMYPAGIHTTVKVVQNQNRVDSVHARRYGYGTKAIAVYVFEENTIYASAKDISESVLVHEMAHCIIDHYFRVRPPRKIEELLAMHVDTQLRE